MCAIIYCDDDDDTATTTAVADGDKPDLVNRKKLS